EDAADYRFNPFDLTKVWPHADYPPITIGRWTLTRNPENYFAEIEQAAFEPANFVPGIGPSPDKMLQGRLFSYPDAHRYRIGTNYLQLPVNRPKSPVHSYNKDGAMTYVNPGDPVYAPNSMGGPVADPDLWAGESYEVAGEIVRSAYRLHREDDDFVQPRALREKVLSDTDRGDTVHGLVLHASAPEVSGDMKQRVVDYCRDVHKDLGDRVAKGLGVNDSCPSSRGGGLASGPPHPGTCPFTGHSPRAAGRPPPPGRFCLSTLWPREPESVVGLAAVAGGKFVGGVGFREVLGGVVLTGGLLQGGFGFVQRAAEGVRDRLQGVRHLAWDDPEGAAVAVGQFRQRLEVLVGEELGVGV